MFNHHIIKAFKAPTLAAHHPLQPHRIMVQIRDLKTRAESDLCRTSFHFLLISSLFIEMLLMRPETRQEKLATSFLWKLVN